MQASIGLDFLLRNISFEITAGEIVGIIGASGAGKTSLLKLLNCLVGYHSGTIYFEGKEIRQHEVIALRRRVVLVPQESKLLAMKVMDALIYPLTLQQLSELEIKARIDKWTSLMHIPSDWFNKTELQLSVGQKQQVAITRALVMEPQVILLDEPTSALDMATANRLLNLLKKLNQSQSLTIVIVNHQLDLIRGFCDRLLLMNQGTVEEDVLATEKNHQRLRQKILHFQEQQKHDWE